MAFDREIIKLVTTPIFLEYYVAVEKNMEKLSGYCQDFKIWNITPFM